jgi:hypothetical protein
MRVRFWIVASSEASKCYISEMGFRVIAFAREIASSVKEADERSYA